MGCPCSAVDTCGCHFASSGDITASGTGAADNPMVLALAGGKLATFVGPSGSPPASSVKGQLWFETDTLRLRAWTGSRWRLISAEASSVDVPGSAVTINGAASGDVVVCSASIANPFGAGDPFTALAGGNVTLFGGLSGEVWEAALYDPQLGFDRGHAKITMNGYGYGQADLIPAPCRSLSGAPYALELHVRNVNTSANVSTRALASDNGIKALVLPS